jgi:protein SCO1
MTSLMHNLHRLFASLLMALATLAAGAEPASSPPLKAGVFSPARLAPDFSLQGSNGAAAKLSDYRGKVVLLGFGFSSCPEVCPTTLATLAQAHRKLGAAGRDLQVIYVTVDPERDSTQRLKQYLDTFDPTFLGATGSPAALAAVRQQYGVQAQRKPLGNTYVMAHSSSTYLIDRAGRLRALMPYGHSPADYVHDLSLLLQEAPSTAAGNAI